MKKYVYKILSLCACLLIFVSILFGCSVADKIEEGTYVCKTPYIKYTEDLSADYHITQEIEIDKKVYKAFAFTDFSSRMFFMEYQEEDVKPASGGWTSDDNEQYATFYYKFDDKKKQLILTDQETGNVYHLDKVE